MYILRVVVNFLRVVYEGAIIKKPVNQKTILFLKKQYGSMKKKWFASF
jgi:hypothetical protein